MYFNEESTEMNENQRNALHYVAGCVSQIVHKNVKEKS